jgi:hypothetical protein
MPLVCGPIPFAPSTAQRLLETGRLDRGVVLIFTASQLRRIAFERDDGELNKLIATGSEFYYLRVEDLGACLDI